MKKFVDNQNKQLNSMREALGLPPIEDILVKDDHEEDCVCLKCVRQRKEDRDGSMEAIEEETAYSNLRFGGLSEFL